MIWGYNKLNDKNDLWFDELITLENDWHYLLDEKNMWVNCWEEKNNQKNQIEFTLLKSHFDKRFHYIFDDYWNLFNKLDILSQDINNLWKNSFALDIAFWIYRHPVWEIGKIANEIVINRLRVKELRSETLGWLLDNWEAEEFYSLSEVIFVLKDFLEFDIFLNFLRKIVNSNDCHLRGSFIADLVIFLERDQNKEFHLIICEDILPQMIAKACDIWEVQELIRLLNFFIKSGTLTESQAYLHVANLEIARDIDNSLSINYNEFWKQAEINKGIIR
jgi:hypothetical protein